MRGTTTTSLSTAEATATEAPPVERVFDYLLAASVMSWAVVGLTASSTPLGPVRWAIAGLHVSVAACLARRAPLRQGASVRGLVSSLPALVLGGLALDAAAPPTEWHAMLEVAFALGAAVAIGSFIVLGESFAILPARRGVVSRGPYRVVRHPAYAGEIVMIAACLLSRPSPAALVIASATLPLVALRIQAEEDLLAQCDAYVRYRRAVRFKLVPGLW